MICHSHVSTTQSPDCDLTPAKAVLSAYFTEGKCGKDLASIM